MWSTFSLSPGAVYLIRFPTASIYLRAEGVLWGAAVEYPPKPQRPAPAALVRSPPRHLDWKYSALLGAAELTLRPALSGSPYEVQLSRNLSIHPRVELDGYIFLPLWAEALLSDDSLLAAYSLRPRKASWFGSSQEGTLCQAAESAFSASEDVGAYLASPDPSIAACPVTIKNDTTEVMELSRLYIPTDILSIYEGSGLFATDRVVCSFTSEGLQVKPKRGRDPLFGDMKVRRTARKGTEVRFFAKGMDILRYLTGI